MKYRNISVWLEDILKAIEEIGSFTAGITSYHQFLENRIIVLATERDFEIIAEALKKSFTIKCSINNNKF
jgi:uncharacterized protein with HEPN domain